MIASGRALSSCLYFVVFAKRASLRRLSSRAFSLELGDVDPLESAASPMRAGVRVGINHNSVVVISLRSSAAKDINIELGHSGMRQISDLILNSEVPVETNFYLLHVTDFE